MVSAKNT